MSDTCYTEEINAVTITKAFYFINVLFYLEKSEILDKKIFKKWLKMSA